MRSAKTHSGSVIPKPLSARQMDVLRYGAVSSGLAGISWTINGEPCGMAVHGLRNRGFITTTPVEVDGRKALLTIPTPAGEAALKEATP